VWETWTREEGLSRVLENTCWEFKAVVTWVFTRIEREGANPVCERGKYSTFDGDFDVGGARRMDLRRAWTM
jgi:hypothetical protein